MTSASRRGTVGTRCHRDLPLWQHRLESSAIEALLCICDLLLVNLGPFEALSLEALCLGL